jgi:hypothetical protein
MSAAVDKLQTTICALCILRTNKEVQIPERGMAFLYASLRRPVVETIQLPMQKIPRDTFIKKKSS